MSADSVSAPARAAVKAIAGRARARVACGATTMPARVFLGLGSNLGARETTLQQAREELQSGGFRELLRSSLYLTEPVGGPPQDWYLNQVIAGETSLSPERLLEACQAVERAHGRERGERNAPRTLDIDILLFGDLVRDDQELQLPHPRLHERRFVLVPLSEIAPDVVHPRLGVSARELLARCPDRSRVVAQAALGARP
jgi:2-amino-4-hydroxy-6-hydroxymethyldihydropteridine diphosphokinase